MNIIDRLYLAVINIRLSCIESEIDHTLKELKTMSRTKHNENKNLQRALQSIRQLEGR